MTIYMVVFRPHKARRLKAGGVLVLPVSLHSTNAQAQRAAKRALKEFPTEEGYYAVEPWSAEASWVWRSHRSQSVVCLRQLD